MRRWPSIAAGVSLGVLLSAALYVTAAPAGVQRPAVVATVDFRQLLDGYDRTKDVEQEVKQTQDDLRTEAQKLGADIQKIEARLTMHQPGSDAYKTTEKELNTKKAEFDVWRRTRTRELLDRQRDILLSMYRDIEKMTAIYARANRIDVVVKIDTIDATIPSVQELDMRVSLKTVLYAAPEIDITSELKTVLNADYKRTKAAKDLERLGK